MAKEALLTLDGQIDEILPDGRFGVMLENDHRIIAYTAGKMRRYRIRVDNGKAVTAEVIDQYKPVSVTYLDIVGALRFEIDDALLLRYLVTHEGRALLPAANGTTPIR